MVIADVLRFGRYTETVLPDEDLLQLRELSRCRVAHVELLGDLKRRVLGILDRIFPEFASCFSTVFGAAPTELLQKTAGRKTPAGPSRCWIGRVSCGRGWA